MIFDKAALFLDHQHILQAFGKASRAALFEWPGQRDLVDAKAEPLSVAFADPEVRERLAQVQIGFSGGDNAKARRLAVEHDAIELVGPRECRNRRHLRAVQPPLLFERRIGPSDAKATRRHFEIRWQHHLHARGIAVDRSGTFDGLGDRLEADPAAGEARKRKTIDPEIQIILQRCRVQDRHQCRGKHLLALVRQRRRLATMIVAGERQHAAMPRRPGRIGVL